MAKVVKINKKKAKTAEEVMAPKSGRDPSSISAKTGSNPQAKSTPQKANKSATVKVQRPNKQVTAKSGENAQASATMPGAATQLTANTTPSVGQLTATFAPNPNLSALGNAASVGEQNEVLEQVTKNANIYDERIGGYGTAQTGSNGMFKETGEQAVKRISSEQKKVKVKKK